AEDGIRDLIVTGVQTCALPICLTLGATATGGQSVALAYTQPASNKLQDAAANATPNFTLSPTNMTSGGSGVVPTFTSATPADGRSEERRVGKEWGSRRGREDGE